MKKLPHLKLHRLALPYCSIGVLSDVHKESHQISFFTLELPYKGNFRDVSCITSGEYLVLPDLFGKYQNFRIENVNNRSNIEFHAGNYVSDTKGCILVGNSLNYDKIKNQYVLSKSNESIEQMKKLYPDGFNLEIINI